MSDEDHESLNDKVKDWQSGIEQERYRLLDVLPDTIAHLDPEIIEAYSSALLDGEEKQNNVRLMVVGFAGVGKTSLVNNLLGQPLIKPKSTDGIDVHHHQCSKDGDWSCKEEHTEEGENKRHLSVVGKIKSFIRLNKPNPKTRPASLVTLRNTRTQTRKVQSETDAILTKNKETGAHYSPDKLDLQVWDFGGQFAYNATHQLFLSRLAVYILVVDASRNLDEIVQDEEFPEGSKAMSVKSFYKFWLQSIHSFVADNHGGPAVILVATHIDKVEDWNENKESELFGNIRSLFEGSPLECHIQRKQFAINNKKANHVMLEQLRRFVIKTADKSAARYHKIPAKWVTLENCLTERKKDKTITVEEVIKLDSENKFPIGNSKQIKMFLLYHHEMGNLIYFDDEGVSDLVVLDPQWIVNAFRCIMTSSNYKLCSEWQKLVKEAILSKKLIQEVWENDTSDNFRKYETELLFYLNKLGIIANVVEIDIDTKQTNNLNTYIVPSFMKGSDVNKDIEHFLNGRKGTATTLVFSFENKYVSPILFHRVTALALGKWKCLVYDGRRLLFENLGVYRIDETHAGLVEQYDKTIEIRAVNLINKNIDCRQTDKFRRYVKAMVLQECSRRKQPKTNIFKLGIRCNYNNVQGKAVKDIDELDKCVSQKIPCPDIIQGHDIDLNVLKAEWQIETIHICRERSKKISVGTGNYERKVSDKELNKIAGAIGQNWELLGVELGITSANLYKIKADNPLSSAVQIFNMLKTWLNTNSEMATMDTLLEHIKSVKQLEVEMDEIKNVRDGFIDLLYQSSVE